MSDREPRQRPVTHTRARHGHVVAALVCLLAHASACKRPGQAAPCNPSDERAATVRVLVQPGDPLNPDAEGRSLAVVVRVYQLKGTAHLETADFNAVWQDGGKAAFGETYVAETELTLYPSDPETLELALEPSTTHLAAVAIVRQPAGRDWIRGFAVPQSHGDAVCRARARDQDWPDPCFYVLVDRYRIAGGDVPPSGFDARLEPVRCPNPFPSTPAPGQTDRGRARAPKRPPMPPPTPAVQPAALAQ